MICRKLAGGLESPVLLCHSSSNWSPAKPILFDGDWHLRRPLPPFPPPPAHPFWKANPNRGGGENSPPQKEKRGERGERIGEGKAKKGGICRSSSGRPWSDLSADMGREGGDNPFLPFLFVVNIMIIYTIFVCLYEGASLMAPYCLYLVLSKASRHIFQIAKSGFSISLVTFP